MTKEILSDKQRHNLLEVLNDRFENNMNRHKGLAWSEVEAKLVASADKLWSLNEMERTGGDPDIVRTERQAGQYIFYDCSAESPKGRRSLCYDREALDLRKETSRQAALLRWQQTWASSF